ncbi:MAG: hypothetical protein PHR77_13635 [Kiritimatiellae bacterium]|nr:hypothetical protein [Kiritimatiellia bacterium]MDD5520734.1 hypothetical protein [Kiritimatiellia bacterium]
MKKYANRHCKIGSLARKLKIHQPMAVGLMENLWQWAAVEIPDGGIGKCTDELIAVMMQWPWPKKAHELITALIDVEYLDKMDNSRCRLYIHDWHSHCATSIHRRLARKGLLFANGRQPKVSPKVEKLTE